MSVQFAENGSEDFNNQYGIVTGGAGGIGLCISRFLLKNGIQKLAVLDKCVILESCRKMISEFGKERVLIVKCDVSIPSDVDEAYKKVMEIFPKLDIVVNNAGILNDHAWENEVATNLNGTIRGTLQAIKYMSKAEGGSGGTIVNMSSLSGLNPSAGCPVYTATSAAVIALTNAFSLPFHYSKTGIRMMNVCPGITYTKIISGASNKMLSEDIGKEWLKELSVSSTQKPENVANGVLHMLLHGTNGSTWICEGGNSIYEISFTSMESSRGI